MVNDVKTMTYFNYQNDQLFAENVSLADIAEQYSTPCYVYSRAALESHYRDYKDGFGDHDLLCGKSKF